MREPTAQQLATLDRFERAAFRLSHEVNRRPALKTLAHRWLRTVGARWVHLCSRNLLHVEGLDQLTALQPDRGVMLVSNHRSFFDLYVVSSVVLRTVPWVERMYFPVRANYFYQRVDGIVVNALMSALAMYPPVMREACKRSFNQYSVELLCDLAAQPGSIVGMHPEGTRSRTQDPYTLLPAQIGAGQVVFAARPIVVPVFVLGLSNDFLGQIRGNFDRTGQPITVVFGAPVELSDLLGGEPRLRTYKRISDRLRDELMKLGQRERSIRASLHTPLRQTGSPPLPHSNAAA